MSELFTIAGGVIGGGALTTVIVTLTLNSKLRGYIRDAAAAPAPEVHVTPSPLTVKAHESAASRAEFEKYQAEIAKKFEHVWMELRRLDAGHNTLAREVSELSAIIKFQGQTLTLIAERLDRISERIK